MDASNCSIPDDYIDPLQHGIFMVRPICVRFGLEIRSANFFHTLATITPKIKAEYFSVCRSVWGQSDAG